MYDIRLTQVNSLGEGSGFQKQSTLYHRGLSPYVSDCKSVGSDKPTTQWDLCIPSAYVFLAYAIFTVENKIHFLKLSNPEGESMP